MTIVDVKLLYCDEFGSWIFYSTGYCGKNIFFPFIKKGIVNP